MIESDADWEVVPADDPANESVTAEVGMSMADPLLDQNSPAFALLIELPRDVQNNPISSDHDLRISVKRFTGDSYD